MDTNKYKPFEPIPLPDRVWPTTVIAEAPLWCSVDLRDGNQALIEPMDRDRKRKMFQKLVEVGFKEIEVGFPSASATDFDFVREIIEDGSIPDDVAIQVLTQSRDELIDRTYESISGAKNAIVHLYNSTSTLQRRVVFNLDEAGIIDIAVKGAERCRRNEQHLNGTNIRYEYSPESFTGTELPFAKQICEEVSVVLGASDEKPLILNLPATVEMSTANIYGDQIEWFHKNIANRESIILSLHPHNDRGTGVAAAEFGMMAGADRVEGTLFGNGERTGNVDIITLALNLYTQGVDPNLDISDINELRRVAEYCNQLPVHPRHPYAGDLVYTAFSGSHQDAIKKGFAAREKENQTIWEIPYLPIDPTDVGRTYEDIIRVNSQSGKGGVSYLLKADYGFDLPRRLQIEFTRSIQMITDSTGKEVNAKAIHQEFEKQYLSRTSPFTLVSFKTSQNKGGENVSKIKAAVEHNGVEIKVQGEGDGLLSAFISALEEEFNLSIEVRDFSQHGLGSGRDVEAACYLELAINGEEIWGVGLNSDVAKASLDALISGLNRSVVN